MVKEKTEKKDSTKENQPKTKKVPIRKKRKIRRIF